MRRITENPFYHTAAPKRPKIRKLGTVMCDVVETTPVVFRDRLYRFEYFRSGEQNEANPTDESHFRFRDMYTNALSKPFGQNHHLGSAYADGEYMYAVGVKGRWAGDMLTVFRSRDLETWEEFPVRFPGLKCFNTGVCKKDGKYILLIETDSFVPFTFRFAQSEDMISWTLLPDDFAFQKDRYAGGPAIYTFPDDPYYYVLYLEAYPTEKYANCAARSLDLKEWEYSPLNPVLMYDAAEDKKIANPFLTPRERERIARAADVNNSDMELCGFLGRTIIYYSWGNQHGIEFLAEAAYEGTPAELLRSFFE
ncbi:MAG: hypothetical protein IJL26_04055 [Clostridia bacterium]|nr:hypothetical protein [Clostridia bacterium]